MGFFSFLLKKKFYLHLLIAILLTFVLIALTLLALRFYTNHNQAYIVPDFKGYTTQDIREQNFEEIFDFIYIDSIYNNDLEPGSVVMQNPLPGSKVKHGRNIYITKVAMMPEIVIMPELKDLTLRQAMTSLRGTGILIDNIHYEPHIAENAVIGQYFNGDTLQAGDELIKGSSIALVLGLGRNRRVQTPFLIGLNQAQAAESAILASFNVGKEYFKEDDDPEHMRVYRQDPEWDSEDQGYRGDYINLWYRSDLYYNFDSLIHTMLVDTTEIDSLNIGIPKTLPEQEGF